MHCALLAASSYHDAELGPRPLPLLGSNADWSAGLPLQAFSSGHRITQASHVLATCAAALVQARLDPLNREW